MPRKPMTEENKQKARDGLARARALKAEKAMQGGVAVAEPVTEKQCLYCGLRFDSDILAEHQRLMHKGDMPTEIAELPKGSDKLAAGAILRAGASATSDGIPLKTPHSKRLLEHGWECDDPGDRVMEEGGWRYIPDPGAEMPPKCQRCGGPMHKISRLDWVYIPDNAPHNVTYQGQRYDLAVGEQNYLPDVITSLLFESIAATKAAIVPPISQVAAGQPGRLNRTGFIADDDDATT